MKTLANILWFLLGGFIIGILWCLFGFLWCASIVGVPVGVQCFKIGTFAFWPFGRHIIPGTRATSLFLNVLWVLLGGVELAAISLCAGLVSCVTVVGIPFGLQYFKLAYISLLPFGAVVTA